MDIEKKTGFISIAEEIEAFNKQLDEKIEKEQQQLKANKKKSELEIKLIQEINLNKELTDRLAELSRRGSELDRVCAALQTHLTISDNDQQRLDNAKEHYQVAKELTGIRWDFSAAPGVAKGYIKSNPRKLLQPFEVPGTDDEALWSLIHSTAAPDWPTRLDKENLPNIDKNEVS